MKMQLKGRRFHSVADIQRESQRLWTRLYIWASTHIHKNTRTSLGHEIIIVIFFLLNLTEQEKINSTELSWLIHIFHFGLNSLLSNVHSRRYHIQVFTSYKQSNGHSRHCSATYNVELRELSLFHVTISHVLLQLSLFI
jgi:hypothetical protein